MEEECMNNEIENILNLLRSDNYEDKLLGIIIMEKQNLTNKILTAGNDTDDWHIRIKWVREVEDEEDGRAVNIILNGKLFSVWKEGLCIMRKRFYCEVAHNELFHNDGSIDIKQTIDEYNKWLQDESK